MSETHIIRSPEVSKCENPKQAHHLECWIPGFRLPGDGDVRDSHHQESRSAEMRKPKTGASLGVLDIGISDTGDGNDKDSHHKESRSHET
jgi:hypothetical protein